MKEQVFNSYVSKVVKKLQITKKEFFTNTKKRQVVDARHIVFYLCYKRDIRMTYIQDYMSRNGYDIPHSVVHYGVQQMEKKVSSDRDYEELVQKLR